MLVTWIDPNGPARKAGLDKWDVIREVDDEPVRDNLDMIAKISSRQPGEKVRINVLRQGKPLNMRITLGDREEALVAEAGGEIVAYARTVKIGLECAMEYGRLPTAAEALAQLIVSLAPKPGALVLRTTPDPGFRDALKTRAARVDSLPDQTPMWRVLDRTLLGSLVGNGADGVDGMSDAGLVHALVEERAVHYWLSDRF